MFIILLHFLPINRHDGFEVVHVNSVELALPSKIWPINNEDCQTNTWNHGLLRMCQTMRYFLRK